MYSTEWTPVRYIHALSQIITEQTKEIQAEEINAEYFPDENLQSVTKPSAWMKDVARFSLPAIKRIIGMYGGQKRENPAVPGREDILDRNLEGFGKLSEAV